MKLFYSILGSLGTGLVIGCIALASGASMNLACLGGVGVALVVLSICGFNISEDRGSDHKYKGY